MIYQDIQITVNQGLAVPDKSLYIFRGDSNIILNFKLVTPQYKLTKDNKDNLVTRFGVDNFELRLQLEKDYNKIIRGVITEDGCCRTQLTQNVIQELRVGTYSYQITLIDDDANAIMTFPICKAKLNILDRMSLTAEELPIPEGLTGEAMADISLLADNGEVLEVFDSKGNYIKTNWKAGDVISSARLNKIEDAVNAINQKEISNTNALAKQISSNFNVLESEIDIVNNRISTVVAHAGDGTKDSELVDARKGHTTLYNRLEQLEDGTLSLNSAVAHLWEIGSTNVMSNVNDDTDTVSIRFSEPIRFNMPVHITCPAGYHFAIWFVHEVGLHMGYESNFMTDFTVSAGMAFRLIFRKNPEVTITEDEIGTYANIIQLSVVPSALVEHVAGDAIDRRIAVKTKIRNIFDKTKVFHGEDGNGGYYNVGGTWQSSSNYVSSPFMPVEPGKLYRDRALSEHIYIQVAFWDENFNPCGGYDAKRDDGWIKVPYDKKIKYLTLPVQKSAIDTKMVIEWDMSLEDFPTDYIPYTDEPQIMEEHLNDVYNAISTLDEKIEFTQSMFSMNDPSHIMVAAEPNETFRTIKEGEYVIDDSGDIAIYNIWSAESEEELEESGEGTYWGHFITAMPKGSIYLGAGCIVVGYKPDSGYVYAFNGNQLLHRLRTSTSSNTQQLLTTDIEGFDETFPRLENILLNVTITNHKLTYSNPETQASFSITRDELREYTGDNEAELCWGETAYINIISVYPYGGHLATLTIGGDAAGAVKVELEREVVRLDNRIDSLAISGGAGAQWSGKTWYAYGTSITSIAQGNYVPYVAKLGGMNYVNKGIPGGSLSNLGGYGKGEIKNAIMNTTDGKLDADLITLETGPNEGDNTTHGTIYDTGDDSYCGCLTQCIQYLQANTNAQIVVIATVATTTPVKDSQVYYERLLLVEQVCKVNHVYFIPTYDGLGTARITANGTKYTVDNIHQSKLGGYNKAHSIWRELKNIPLFYSSTDDLPTL